MKLSSPIYSNKSTGINTVRSQHLHRLPWFLIGAMASTISTVYLYFEYRPKIPIHKKSTNSIEPPRT